MAENIATRLREQEDQLKAWMAVLKQSLNSPQLAKLDRAVLDEVTRVRSDEAYRESLAQFQRELDAAKDDNALISVLYYGGPGWSNLGQD